jgi:hypothetical protein
MIVIAATGIGWLLAKTPPLPHPVAIAGVVIAAAVIISMVPAAISRGRVEHRDLRAQRARTKEIGALSGVISRAGGAALLRQCGEPLTRLEYQTILAWNLKVNVARVGFKYGAAIQRHAPIVLFTPTHHGWKLQAFHQRLPQCRRLPA